MADTYFKSIFQTFNPFKDKGAIKQLLKPNEVDSGDIYISRDDLPKRIKDDSQLTTQYALYIAGLKIGDYRDSYYQAYSSIKNNYLLQAVLEIMSDDALRPDKATGNVITLKSSNPDYQKKLDRLQARVDLDTIINDITPDLLLYGEYVLKIIKEGDKGVVHLDDIYDAKDILPIYQGGKITSFLLKKHDFNLGAATGNALLNPDNYVDGGAIELPFRKVSIKDYAYFVRYGKRIKVKLLPENLRALNWSQDSDLSKLLSGVVRIGRSIIPISLVNMIKSLETLESIIPLLRLLQLDRRSLIGVRFPGVTKIEKAAELVKEYERIINDTYSKASAVQQGNVSVEDFLASTTKYRIIPLLGDKGNIEISDIPAPVMGTMDDFNYLKTTILDGIGIPSTYVIGGEGMQKDNLKGYVRYLKKITSIQRSIVQGLKHIGVVHLRALGDKVVPSDIQVEFANIVSVENLDELEFLDILTSLLRNYYDFIKDIDTPDGPTGGIVAWPNAMQFLYDKLRTFSGSEKFLQEYIDKFKKVGVDVGGQQSGYTPPPKKEEEPEGLSGAGGEEEEEKETGGARSEYEEAPPVESISD